MSDANTAPTELAKADFEGLLRPTHLGRWLAERTGDDRWVDGLEADLITGGKSNLTFVVRSPAGEVILRRQPSGVLLPGAHDMGREVRVQSALAGSGVPVAPIVGAELTGDVLGATFYVMERVDGHVVRGDLPADFGDDPQVRADISRELVSTLAKLHQISPDDVGLEKFGRPDGFVERQIGRWFAQYEASKDNDIAEVHRLKESLLARVPTAPRNSILHGDYRLDNVILRPDTSGSIAAVLDWELSSLGDPLADLGMFLLYWRDPNDPDIPLVPSVTRLPGFMRRAELIDTYATITGIDVRSINFYIGFSYFKFAIIALGVFARSRAGSMGGQQFAGGDAEVRELLDAGLERMHYRA